jgi:hypothetical protein
MAALPGPKRTAGSGFRGLIEFCGRLPRTFHLDVAPTARTQRPGISRSESPQVTDGEMDGSAELAFCDRFRGTTDGFRSCDAAAKG